MIIKAHSVWYKCKYVVNVCLKRNNTGKQEAPSLKWCVLCLYLSKDTITSKVSNHPSRSGTSRFNWSIVTHLCNSDGIISIFKKSFWCIYSSLSCFIKVIPHPSGRTTFLLEADIKSVKGMPLLLRTYHLL